MLINPILDENGEKNKISGAQLNIDSARGKSNLQDEDIRKLVLYQKKMRRVESVLDVETKF